jgi:cellulose synthase/poly-beta-1,6-N-acetylglucosamine synthase-like glycosyltransferase
MPIRLAPLWLIPSLIFIITAIRLKIKKEKYDFFPPVSVISWTWKDGNIIERKIKNFLSQNYPGKFEVIIVDNASEDETREICERYAKKGLIKYYRTKKAYDRKAYGLDEAIKKVARYDILAMTDPDGVCEKNWLKKIVQPFKDKSVGAVIGLTHCGNFYVNLFTKLRAVEDEWFYAISPLGNKFSKSVHLVCGANYALRRKALKSVGYHGKKTLGEDFEVTIKLYNKGWNVRAVNANVWQEEVETLKEYIRQRLRWHDTAIVSHRYYFHQIMKILKKRPLGLLLFYFSFSIYIFAFIYLLLTLYNPLIGLLGFFFCNLAIVIGLVKLKRYFLIPYVPLYLVIEPFLVIYCLLLREYLLLRKRKIVWRSLYDHYYHRGRRIVMK